MVLTLLHLPMTAARRRRCRHCRPSEGHWAAVTAVGAAAVLQCWAVTPPPHAWGFAVEQPWGVPPPQRIGSDPFRSSHGLAPVAGELAPVSSSDLMRPSSTKAWKSQPRSIPLSPPSPLGRLKLRALACCESSTFRERSGQRHAGSRLAVPCLPVQ